MAQYTTPIAFSKWPVTLLISAVFIAIISSCLYVQHIVPAAPAKGTGFVGVDLNQAWSDLRQLSRGYHAFNSHNNDVVRQWILERITGILQQNNVSFEQPLQTGLDSGSSLTGTVGSVVVYDDLSSNLTFSRPGATSTYFESSNIIVYIEGSNNPHSQASRQAKFLNAVDDSCILVNAHFDSVSTGFGVTDDGVGVISLLQLLAHYTIPSARPRQCLILLFNNGEEDYLHGAFVFSQHPLASRISAFMNLEGAGAGGRATIFRSTDAEVAAAYQRSPYPFGTAVSADAFRRGLIRSQTDYVVFESLGYRGVDVAFVEPRSFYHTFADSTKETSINSVWHMLSAALATTKSMLNHGAYGAETDEGSESVYFDLYGRALGLMNLNVLVDISIGLLVLGPLLLLIVVFFLVQRDKWYIFAGKAYSDPLDPHTPDEQVAIDLRGIRGFFRTPVSLILAAATAIGLALLQAKTNPLIIYSSPYAVWSLILSAFSVVSWFCLSAADRTRPTAFQRLYAFTWLYVLSWAALVFLVVIEIRYRICGAYIGLFFSATALLTLLSSLLELLNLPSKSEFVRQSSHIESSLHTPAAPTSRPLSSRGPQDAEDPDESSPLLNRRSRSHSRLRLGSQSQLPRFLNHTIPINPSSSAARSNEQPWSTHLPSSLWSLQFLLFAFVIILVTQLSLFLTSTLPQTLGDGLKPLQLYLAIAILSVLLLLPTTPFIHRLSSRIIIFLFAVFVGTLIYNLAAFPFSRSNRLKVYFQQRLDIDDPTTTNTVSLTAIDSYLQTILAEIPSARGQELNCTAPGKGRISGLTTCTYQTSLLPKILHPHHTPNTRDWLTLTTTNTTNATTSNTATLNLTGLDTRACKFQFNDPIISFNVSGSAPEDERFPKIPADEDNITSLRLFSRDWGRTWEVSVRWENEVHSEETDGKRGGDGGEDGGEKGGGNEGERLTGQAVCMWSDENDAATIPALTEVEHYMPVWSIVTKLDVGLVEGYRDFGV